MQYEIFKGAEKLWNAFMKNVSDYVNSLGGEARVGTNISKRLSWDKYVKPKL
jgi:hypothetical protein